MVLTAPAMINGRTNTEAGNSLSHRKEGPLPFFTANVIKRFVDHPTVIAMRAFPRERSAAVSVAMSAGNVSAAVANAAVANATAVTNAGSLDEVSVSTRTGAEIKMNASTKMNASIHVSAATKATATSAAAKTASSADAKAAELRMVIRQAVLIYTAMDLQGSGLDEKAFEYAWRGYHNLLKKGIIHKKAVLSICDFSQSSRNKRMYVSDVQHKKLLYRTYVAHGQNSGDEFATSFSNENDSYKSSLGFYVTQKTYMGRNGLSLRLDGVDPGYNDQAMKRKIVLHGSPYAGEKYMQDYGNLGTSLGCPALPVEVSGRINRTVKEGSCLFIYHPTPQYLDNSTILHG